MSLLKSRPGVFRAVGLGVALTVALSLLGAGILGMRSASRRSAAALECPDGYVDYAQAEARITKVMDLVEGSTPAFEQLRFELTDLREAATEFDRSAGPTLCVPEKHPETIEELGANFAQQVAKSYAPASSVKPGASANAYRQKLATRVDRPENLTHRWQRVGEGPLQSADEGYGVSSLGLVELAGRITDFAWDGRHEALYASVAYGGVWKSSNLGRSWRSVGGSLPTQIVGGIGYSKAAGGTLIAITGDGSFGSSSREGFGAYYSRNDGDTWRRAEGVPSNAFGFKVEIDPARPRRIYLATGTGLFRSANGGRSYENVVLPTGECAGKSNRMPGCLFDNIVTDVVVRHPGGTTDSPARGVIAAVGWRGGNRPNPDGTEQSPNNGLYYSDEGIPGTFEKLEPVGFAPQNRIGRIELGETVGKEQNHDVLYAIVQDAVLMRNGAPLLDVPQQLEGVHDYPTVLNGIYSSPDFGRTWTKMSGAEELLAPTTGSALLAFAAIGNYAPGVQAWYNLFIEPDPTRADPATGIPSRVVFGLEEVWQNETTHAPAMGKTPFRVIGRYFSGDTCQALTLPVAGPCPTDREDALEVTTTTHPDQHAAIWIPRGDGRVTLIVGNDGGVYKQTVAADGELDNAHWGKGANRGMNTLLPYHAARANDGTVWMGLQDNGTAIVKPKGRQIMALGGDGFFVAVNPRNSKEAYGETPGGSMSATSDGGKTWSAMSPPITEAQFSNPFSLDPKDPNHLLTAGNEVVETGSGTGTADEDWVKVFDLGTRLRPGNPKIEETAKDPNNAVSATTLNGNYAYVAYCGTCDVLDNPAPFRSGIATNVAGSKPAKKFTANGWHIAEARGLPERYINSVAMDPDDPKTVYVALGGYSRRWTPPGSLDQATMKKIGEGHLYVSHNGGKRFKDVSYNLPDIPANWVTVRKGQVLVGTDNGVFAERGDVNCLDRVADRSCRQFADLGVGLPNVSISSIEVAPNDLNLITVATWGRGLYEYRFGPKDKPESNGSGGPQVVTDAPDNAGQVVAGPFIWETSDEGWIVKSGTDAHIWRRGPGGHNSSSAFQVVPYSNESNTTLRSPEFTLPRKSTVEVSFMVRHDIEPDCACDFLLVDWSTDGHLWRNAVALNGMNASYPNYDEHKFSLRAPAGPLYLRMRLASDQLVASPPHQGVWIDDLKVTI